MKRSRTNTLILLITAVVALASGLLTAGRGARLDGGIPALALDDSYIHLQYGWQAAHGHFLQYNTGDDPSTGATSLLYMLIVAVGFAAGITREAMPGITIGAGIALFVLAAVLLADLTRRVVRVLYAPRGPLDDTPPPPFPAWSAGLIAGLIFGGSGWMAWAYVSGMETGLLITLVVATLWAFQVDRVRLTALLAALAVLTRPEAVILAGLLILAQIIRDPAETNDRRRRFLWACTPLGAALVSPAINLLLTGTPSATGLIAKSWFTVEPFYLDRTVERIARTVLDVLGRVFGGSAPDGRWHALPLAQVLMLIGLGLVWGRGRIREKRLVLVTLGWVVLGVGATATLQTATWHHYRYQMPLYPALIAPLAVALSALGSALAVRLGRRRRAVWGIGGAGLLVLAVWTGFTLHDFGAAYALDTGTVVRQQAVLADWLRENTPDDALVAVHDVGMMRFVGQRATLDVVGLTTAAMARVGRNGPGAIYEALESAQPDFFAVYPETANPFFGVEAAPALLGEELTRVTIAPWSPYTSAADTQVITRPDWSAVTLADMPHQPHLLPRLEGWSLVDSLDVADLTDEADHDYRWWQAGRPAGYLTMPLRMAYHDDPALVLADGGRLLTGGASFTVRVPDPGEWLMLVVRVHEGIGLELRVRVNDVDAGLWRLPAMPGEWLESAFLIQPDLLRGSEARIALDVQNASAEQFYSAFHYWAYQGMPEVLPPAPGTITDAAFAHVVSLRGFDLPGRYYAPGDVLPLTLHWEALYPYPADHRVFIHLIDPTNDTTAGIIAQMDGVPLGGTYPFWVWRDHEFVTDEMLLAIPPDTPPGDYLLLLGIYDGATGARLPIVGGDDFGADRLILGTIYIR